MWPSNYIVTLQGSGGANIIATEDRLSRVVSLTDGYSGSDLTAVSTRCHLQHCTCREVFCTVIFGGAAQHCTVLFYPLLSSSELLSSPLLWTANYPARQSKCIVLQTDMCACWLYYSCLHLCLRDAPTGPVPCVRSQSPALHYSVTLPLPLSLPFPLPLTTYFFTSHVLLLYFSRPPSLPLRCARKQLWGLLENWDRKHCSRWRQKMSDHLLKR